MVLRDASHRKKHQVAALKISLDAMKMKPRDRRLRECIDEYGMNTYDKAVQLDKLDAQLDWIGCLLYDGFERGRFPE